jgi:hypothetical protein
MQLRRQLPGAATKVDDAWPRGWANERHQIEEGLATFLTKAIVLLGVPCIVHSR